MTKITISVSKTYARYLAKHLAVEHPRTKGKIKIRA